MLLFTWENLNIFDTCAALKAKQRCATLPSESTVFCFLSKHRLLFGFAVFAAGFALETQANMVSLWGSSHYDAGINLCFNVAAGWLRGCGWYWVGGGLVVGWLVHSVVVNVTFMAKALILTRQAHEFKWLLSSMKNTWFNRDCDDRGHINSAQLCRFRESKPLHNRICEPWTQ